MPLMKGRATIRRTLKYLERGDLFLKGNLKIMAVNYNPAQKSSEGAYDFVFWHLPQLRYKNPKVQFLTYKNMTPTSWIQFFNGYGDTITMDCYSKSKEEIYDHVKSVFCIQESTEFMNSVRDRQQRGVDFRANRPEIFGKWCQRHCICVEAGQVPCPGWVPLPKHMRGKYKNADAEESEV